MVDHRFQEPEEVQAVVRVAVEVLSDHRQRAVEQQLENLVHVRLQRHVVPLDYAREQRNHLRVFDLLNVVLEPLQN